MPTDGPRRPAPPWKSSEEGPAGPWIPTREETGDTRERRQETGDRRQETGDRRQETGDRRGRPDHRSPFLFLGQSAAERHLGSFGERMSDRANLHGWAFSISVHVTASLALVLGSLAFLSALLEGFPRGLRLIPGVAGEDWLRLAAEGVSHDATLLTRCTPFRNRRRVSHRATPPVGLDSTGKGEAGDRRESPDNRSPFLSLGQSAAERHLGSFRGGPWGTPSDARSTGSFRRGPAVASCDTPDPNRPIRNISSSVPSCDTFAEMASFRTGPGPAPRLVFVRRGAKGGAPRDWLRFLLRSNRRDGRVGSRRSESARIRFGCQGAGRAKYRVHHRPGAVSRPGNRNRRGVDSWSRTLRSEGVASPHVVGAVLALLVGLLRRSCSGAEASSKKRGCHRSPAA